MKIKKGLFAILAIFFYTMRVHKTGDVLEGFSMKFRVMNMQTSPDDYLISEIDCEAN